MRILPLAPTSFRTIPLIPLLDKSICFHRYPLLSHFSLRNLQFPSSSSYHRRRSSFFMEYSSHSPAQDVSPSRESDVFRLIRAHQETAARLPPIEEIRTVLEYSVRGVLSTFSQKQEGYPLGSMVDFACDPNGYPILAISSLAAHTKNLLDNSKCSLVVARNPEDRTDLVITLFGNAFPISDMHRVDIRSAYLAKHPNSFWVDFGDFLFMRIEPKSVQYLSWQTTTFLRSGEFTNDEYVASKIDPIFQFSKPVAAHMNRDHSGDTKVIVQHSTSISVDFADMLELDSLGFNVKAGFQGNTFPLRIPFPRRAESRKDVKTLIVEMLEAAKSQMKHMKV